MTRTNTHRRRTAADLLPYQQHIPGSHIRSLPWLLLAEVAIIIAVGLLIGFQL
ncbi:MAG: hypothetical protein H6842_05740 [Rhodospirillaceae bacterium]|nr:hypothetical protein [Rhodospirillaceae bacterium]